MYVSSLTLDCVYSAETGPLPKEKAGCSTAWYGKSPHGVSPKELIIDHNLEQGESECGSSSK